MCFCTTLCFLGKTKLVVHTTSIMDLSSVSKINVYEIRLICDFAQKIDKANYI